MSDLWNIVNRSNLYEYSIKSIGENKRLLNEFHEKFNSDRNKYTHKINSIHVGNDNDVMDFWNRLS